MHAWEVGCNRRSQDELRSGGSQNGFDSCDEVGGAVGFGEVAPRSAPARRGEISIAGVGRQECESQAGMTVTESVCDFKDIGAWHFDVQEHEVGEAIGDRFEQVLSTFKEADHLEGSIVRELCTQAFKNDGVIVHAQDSCGLPVGSQGVGGVRRPEGAGWGGGTCEMNGGRSHGSDLASAEPREAGSAGCRVGGRISVQEW